MFNIVGRRNLYFLLSGLIILPGLIALLVWGLRLGIDFTGGSLIEVRIDKNPATSEVRAVLAQNDHPEASVVTSSGPSGGASYIIRTRTLDTPAKNQLVSALRTQFGSGQGDTAAVTEDRFESVGPLVGAETTREAIISVIAASLLILLYLSWAFRQVPKPWRYGACAVIALLHDVLVVLGIWAILGRVFGLEVEALFVTGVLTVVGFSVHDTIVVFDRIRENVARFPGESFERIVNFSVNQTLDRSLNTTLTVLFTLTALLLLGGVTIRNFVLVLLVGITSGTYSSIFNASCLLVVWENGDLGRLWRRLTGRGEATPAPAAS
jgi:preprotein translocase subunit SecF